MKLQITMRFPSSSVSSYLVFSVCVLFSERFACILFFSLAYLLLSSYMAALLVATCTLKRQCKQINRTSVVEKLMSL